MNENFDVLEVMDQASINLFEVGRPADGRKLDEARAAVAELIEAASEVRTSLSLIRLNVMKEIKRGANQWEGVPTLLEERIETFDAALARVRGAT